MTNDPNYYDAYLESFVEKIDALADCETRIWSAINKCLTELKGDRAFSDYMTDKNVRDFKASLSDTIGDFFYDGKVLLADEIDRDDYDADAIVSGNYLSNPDKDGHPDHIIKEKKP